MNLSSKDIFREIFHAEPEMTCFAPGRVNLIGEHTDYNGGFVFPCALDLGTECSARKRTDSKLRLYSENFSGEGVIEITLDKLSKTGRWIDYPVGVIRAFNSFGYEVSCGADIVFCGNLPDGAGLSSSAALEVLTGVLLRELYSFHVTPQELAVFGQFAENRFIGVNCGIMDQFASALGKKDHAVLLNTDTLEFKYAPLPCDKTSILIVNSGVKHSLASSAYNDRRRECERALSDIRKEIAAASLCAITPDEFSAHSHTIRDSVCAKRAKHAVGENARTIAAYDALINGDLSAFGRLMNESHVSLRDDYEVSCPEIDYLVETAWKIEGVLGARMTGGGFGGCTVNLVYNSAVDTFFETIKAAYSQRFGIDAAIYTVKPGDGARRI